MYVYTKYANKEKKKHPPQKKKKKKKKKSNTKTNPHNNKTPKQCKQLWWSLCTSYLHACQVRVTVGDSGLRCCVLVASLERSLTALFVDVVHIVS